MSLINRNELIMKMSQVKEIVDLVNKHNLTRKDIDDNFNVLLFYMLNKEKCKNCKSLDNCSLSDQGFHPVLDYDGISFVINYLPCRFKEKLIKQQLIKSNLKTISCNLENLNLDDVYVNEKRKDVLLLIKKCIDDYLNNIPTKGLYLHGAYGCGKTYLLAYLAKKLSNTGVKVIFTYYPDLVRTIKNSIGLGTNEKLINDLKEVDVLVLDDFGGEMLTSFIRDEVLGAILQDRMLNNRLTFMSSNLDEKLLLDHLKESSKDVDELRASRIYERIRVLMKFVELKDQNYRF